MSDRIVPTLLGALLRALCWALPILRRAAQSEPKSAPEPRPVPLCGWRRPINPYHLLKSIPPVPAEFRISPWVLQREATPEPERRAILAELAARQRAEWVRFRTEWEKTHDTPAKQQRRRVDLFAAGLDLMPVGEFGQEMPAGATA